MKRINKSFVLILILTCVFVFIGCNSIRLKTFKDSDENINEIEENDDNAHIDDLDNKKTEDLDSLDDEDSDSTDSAEPTSTVIQPIDNNELIVYVVNSSTDLDPVTALIPANNEITPELIIDTVVDSMADQSLVIGIEDVSTQDDTVIVSFYADQPPLSNVGSGLEDAILNAIAQSLTDNLDDYHKVIYRVEGGPYISGHIELGIDEVYFEDAR